MAQATSPGGWKLGPTLPGVWQNSDISLGESDRHRPIWARMEQRLTDVERHCTEFYQIWHRIRHASASKVWGCGSSCSGIGPESAEHLECWPSLVNIGESRASFRPWGQILLALCPMCGQLLADFGRTWADLDRVMCEQDHHLS